MRRAAVIAVLAVSLAIDAGAAPPAGARGAAAVPILGATLDSCASGALPLSRVVTITGSMPAIAGSHQLWMRFDLQQRGLSSGAWQAVRDAPGFGSWERSLPDRVGFVFHKRVDGLPVPGAYRALVRFRWYDAGGRLQRRAQRRTRVCHQPDLRPNLVPGRLSADAGTALGMSSYVLVVSNKGRADAGPFAVTIAGGSAQVPGLAKGQSTTVVVTAPRCPLGTPVSVVVDADQRVDEASEPDDAARRACPVAGA